jgi:hypothetical protein
MPALLAGIAALVLVVFGARAFANANPQTLALLMRKVAGVILLILALFLLTRGAVPLAIPIGLVGLGFLGLPLGSWFGFGNLFDGGSARKSPGQRSSVRTETLEMTLDHDSGEMEGRCLQGKFAGRSFSSLSDDDLLALLDELHTTDGKGAILVEAYLDRRVPDWRERHADSAKKEAPRGRASGGMTRDEAYHALGLKSGASDDEIRAAHRKLMKKVHPDQGGSDYLAARINEAKDVLLGGK